MEETDGSDFDWFIVNEDDLVIYLRGERFKSAQKGSGEGVYKIAWEVPEKGPWILVLETAGTQLIRKVEVHLRLENE